MVKSYLARRVLLQRVVQFHHIRPGFRKFIRGAIATNDNVLRHGNLAPSQTFNFDDGP